MFVVPLVPDNYRYGSEAQYIFERYKFLFYPNPIPSPTDRGRAQASAPLFACREGQGVSQKK